MTPEQIKQLAREYAEEAVKQPEDMSNSLHNEYLKLFADEAEELIRWLLRRFCLVEKSRLGEEYHEAKFTCGNVDPCSETFATSLAQKSVLERLFPDLGKEVEECP